MSWHRFRAEQSVPLDKVVEACEKHISSGKVKNRKEKMKRLDLIRNCGQELIIYRPTGSGWDNSPMNQNCWQTWDRKPICEPSVVSRS